MTQAVTIVNNVEEEEDARFARESELIQAEFPDAPFDVCVDAAELDDDLGQNEIEVILDCSCFCFELVGHRKLSIKVKPTGSNVSVKVKEAIHALESVYSTAFACDHRFMEGFNEVRPGVFDVFMGS